MNGEQLNKVLETIQTFNFNVDSQTLTQVVEELKPVLYFFLIKDLLMQMITAIGMLIGIWMIGKIVFKVGEHMLEEQKIKNSKSFKQDY